MTARLRVLIRRPYLLARHWPARVVPRGTVAMSCRIAYLRHMRMAYELCLSFGALIDPFSAPKKVDPGGQWRSL